MLKTISQHVCVPVYFVRGDHIKRNEYCKRKIEILTIDYGTSLTVNNM